MAASESSHSRMYFVCPLFPARDWQERPEFDRLCRWWATGGVGVCALVGIGGAGKTAIAERFLRVLPGVLPVTPNIAKHNALPTPQSLFVFSFYDAPNPDSFFVTLAAWLNGSVTETSTPPPSYQQTLLLLQQARSCLLVLDGLEKVQDDGVRGGVFGQLLDGRLRDFVLRLALGYLPDVGAIITTRFPLADLEDEIPPHYMPIAVDEISEDAGVALLRQRGVPGPDAELRRLVNECGRHALTIDLAGGFLAEFGGRPTLTLGTVDEIQQAVRTERNPRRRRVLQQEYRFARIAQEYCDALAAQDPAALALIERVCLFRLGVDARVLADIFTGENKEAISGQALARLNKKQLQAKLDLLVDMRLLETTARETSASQLSSDNQPSPHQYTVHPAVRDGFLKGLTAETARRNHAAVRDGLKVSLGSWPGQSPADPSRLDLLEETVYHTLAAGHANEAWDIYWERLGRYENLGRRLSAFDRGERICRVFAEGQRPESAPIIKALAGYRQGRFLNQWALYLMNLGQVQAAANCFAQVAKLAQQEGNSSRAAMAMRNFVEAVLLRGELQSALQAAEEAVHVARDAGATRKAQAHRAQARAMRGDVDGAVNDFHAALEDYWHNALANPPEFELFSLWQATLLLRLGNFEKATAVTQRTRQIHRQRAYSNYASKLDLLLADLAREQGDLATARDLLETAHEGVIARDVKEPLCWSALVRARVALAEIKGRGASGEGAAKLREEATNAIEDGLRIARDCGFGIYHIDLLILRAQVALETGNTNTASRDLLVALEQGVQPSEASGLPTLLAATDPVCGYAWGEAAARHLLAATLLLQAAQTLGQSEFVPARFNGLDNAVKVLINDARDQLNRCIHLRQQIQDPKIKDTEELLEQLDGGILTEYPLALVARPEGARPADDRSESPSPTARNAKIMNDASQQRMAHLEDNIRQNYALLNRYEKALILEDDPRRQMRYEQEIEDLRQAVARFRTELVQLQEETGNVAPGAASLLDQMDRKLDTLITGQANIDQQLTQFRHAVLSRFDQLEQQTLRAVIDELTDSQLQATDRVLQVVAAGQVATDDLHTTVADVQRLLTEAGARLVQGNPNVADAINHVDMVVKDAHADVQHKLKVAIPIIPLLLSYETELGLASGINVSTLWDRVCSWWRG